MTRHILGLSGSPRAGGNTDFAVQETLRQIAQRTDAATEFLRLRDYHIDPCVGCRQCMTLEDCFNHRDQFHEVWQKLVQADWLLLGAPVYWNGPPGMMKNFIDRSHAFYAAPEKAELRGKQAVILSVAADSGFEPHESVMQSWLRYYGVQILERVRLLAREKDDLRGHPAEQAKLQALAERLCRA